MFTQYEKAAKLLDSYYQKNSEEIEKRKRFPDDKTEKIIAEFQKKYSPRWLKNVSKSDVLEDIFSNTVDSYINIKSLIYTLAEEGEDVPLSHFGHIGRQYVNHFPLYRSELLWKVGMGLPNSNKKLSESEAKEFAFRFKNALADLLIETDESYFTDLDAYEKFSAKITKSLNYSSQAWLHKYLHLLYPYAFSDFHSKNYKKTVLKIFDIEPISDDQIILAGQIAEIFRNTNIPGYYTFACTIYSIPGFSDLIKKDNSTEKVKAVREYLIKSENDNVVLIDNAEVENKTHSNSEFDESSYSENAIKIAEELSKEIDGLNVVGETKEAVIKQRVNQDVFRKELLKRYKKCCLCGVSNTDLLIASHIKPWSASEPKERLDINNGFIFCPNHDKLFDKGLISFSDNGEIMISEQLGNIDRMFTNVDPSMRITLSKENKKYLEYHRLHVFNN